MRNIFNFANPDGAKRTIKRTWDEFRDALAREDFEYTEIEKAKHTVFLKALNDLFNVHDGTSYITRALHDLRIHNYILGRGAKLRNDEIVSYDRFIPKSQYITDMNRFSPVGVEWLYLAISENLVDSKECAKAECRVTSADRFAFCQFEIDASSDSLQIIDLTLANEIAFDSLNSALEAISQDYIKQAVNNFFATGILSSQDTVMQTMKPTITQWAIFTYAKLLSEQIFIPLKTADRKLEYTPFQTLAQYFITLGYNGIIYSSTVYPKGRNLVLFDKSIASPCGSIDDSVL